MPRDMNVPIKDMKLVREQCYIDGQWADAMPAAGATVIKMAAAPASAEGL